MISIRLGDREEIRHGGEWFVSESPMTVDCPGCKEPTDSTVTHSSGTLYYHGQDEHCAVAAEDEPVPKGFERAENLIRGSRSWR